MQCTYCFKNTSLAHIARHLKVCKVKNNELTLLTEENTKLREENKKYVRLEAKHQALVKLIKKHPPPRLAMPQNRRLRIAAGQNWECAICHMKLICRCDSNHPTKDMSPSALASSALAAPTDASILILKLSMLRYVTCR